MRKIALVLSFVFFFNVFGSSWITYATQILDLKYAYEETLDILKDALNEDQIFIPCQKYLKNSIKSTQENIDILEQIYDLAIEADDTYSNIRGGHPTMTSYMVQGMVDREIEKISGKIDDLTIKSTNLKNSSKKDESDYFVCPEKQQDIYESNLDKATILLQQDDVDGALNYLNRAKDQVYPKTEHYKYVMNLINKAEEYKTAVEEEEAEAKKLEDAKKEAERLATKKANEEKKAEASRIAAEKKLAAKKAIEDKKLLDSDSSDANVLGSIGIINKKDNEAQYNLDSLVLRQEVIGMAMKISGITLPTEHICRNIFKDVANAKPNNWICRAVEIAVENGIVSSANKNFNPESNITRAEALALLMKAAGIKIQEGGVSKYTDVTVPWQVNIINTAFSYSFIDAADNFYPNKNATRGEIFNIAKRILKSKA